jgi:hypothetical protein
MIALCKFFKKRFLLSLLWCCALNAKQISEVCRDKWKVFLHSFEGAADKKSLFNVLPFVVELSIILMKSQFVGNEGRDVSGSALIWFEADKLCLCLRISDWDVSNIYAALVHYNINSSESKTDLC